MCSFPPAPTYTQLIVLDGLMVPGRLDMPGREYAARRYATLLSIGTEDNKRGGMGKATKVFNCFGEPLCLKSMARVVRAGRSESEWRETFVARAIAFKGEYTCQRALLGTNRVPAVYGYGTYAGGPVMLMEWVQGVSLRKAFYGRRADATTCALLGAQVCSTLLSARMCDNRFVHRDISCNNIMLRTNAMRVDQQLATRHFDTCLIDFGSAVSSKVNEAPAPGRHSPIWRNATPEFAPPEMLTHSDQQMILRRYSQRIDVYALCSVLWELYSGHTPHMLTQVRPASPFEYKLSHNPGKLAPAQPADEFFVRVLYRGIAPQQKDRPSLAKLWRAFARICQQGGAGAWVERPQAPASQPIGHTVIRA